MAFSSRPEMSPGVKTFCLCSVSHHSRQLRGLGGDREEERCFERISSKNFAGKKKFPALWVEFSCFYRNNTETSSGCSYGIECFDIALKRRGIFEAATLISDSRREQPQGLPLEALLAPSGVRKHHPWMRFLFSL